MELSQSPEFTEDEAFRTVAGYYESNGSDSDPLTDSIIEILNVFENSEKIQQLISTVEDEQIRFYLSTIFPTVEESNNITYNDELASTANSAAQSGDFQAAIVATAAITSPYQKVLVLNNLLNRYADSSTVLTNKTRAVLHEMRDF